MAKSYPAGVKIGLDPHELDVIEDIDSTPSALTRKIVNRLGAQCLGGKPNLRVVGVEGSVPGFEDGAIVTCSNLDCTRALQLGCPLRTLAAQLTREVIMLGALETTQLAS